MTATAAAPQPTSTALARQKVYSILASDEARRQIAPFLKPGVSLERVISTIHQVVAENPELLECTPESIVMAVGKGVEWDLSFGETVHLVPFNVNVAKKGQSPKWEKRAKALRDYKGDIELVKRAGQARAVDANVFYEHEALTFRQGTHPYIEHHPIIDPKKRGKMIGAYAWVLINQRTPMKICVMSVEEIDKIRSEKSKSWKDGPLQPWYACKTVIHQVTKTLPKNPELLKVQQMFDRDDHDEIPEAEFEVVGAAVAGSTPQTADRTSNGADPGQTTAHVQEAATPAPTAAADNTPSLDPEVLESDLAALTLDQAKAIPLLGPATAWGGKGGQPLDSFSSKSLAQIRSWCIDQIEHGGDDPQKQQAVVAIDLILKSREAAAT